MIENFHGTYDNSLNKLNFHLEHVFEGLKIFGTPSVLEASQLEYYIVQISR